MFQNRSHRHSGLRRLRPLSLPSQTRRMKISLVCLAAAIILDLHADAKVSSKSLLPRRSDRNDDEAVAAGTPAAESIEADVEVEALLADDEELDAAQRELSDGRSGGCWNNAHLVAKWHPTYSQGWTSGSCKFTKDCDSPGYSSELACCKGAYAGQTSGYCLQQLPSPPTTSPTKGGGLDVYYPQYDIPWSDAFCTNAGPLPSGRPMYSTMLSCCKGAYAGQTSGKCLASLPNPPTGSPTNSAHEADFWYPDYATEWSDAGCSNKLPLPFNNKRDRPNYPTQIGCCKAAYGGQVSGKCLAQLPNPPTTSPTGSGGADFFYPDYGTPWSHAVCKNTLPLPYTTGGRPEYHTGEACCRGAYSGQVSHACLCTFIKEGECQETPSQTLPLSIVVNAPQDKAQTLKPTSSPQTLKPTSSPSTNPTSSPSTNPTTCSNCEGTYACTSLMGGPYTAVVSCESCVGQSSCLGAGGTIGDYSCVGVAACSESFGVIGEGSCIGEAACAGNTVKIGNNSCKGVEACLGRTTDVPDNECNGDGQCVL